MKILCIKYTVGTMFDIHYVEFENTMHSKLTQAPKILSKNHIVSRPYLAY